MFWLKKKKSLIVEVDNRFFALHCDDSIKQIMLLAQHDKNKWIRFGVEISAISFSEDLKFNPLLKNINILAKENRCLIKNIRIGSYLHYYKAPMGGSIGPITRIWELKEGETIK